MKRALAVLAGLIGLASLWWWQPAPSSERPSGSVGRPPSALAKQVVVMPEPVRGRVLEGHVRSDAGTPIAGAQVCAHCASCNPSLGDSLRCVVASRDGAYALLDLEPLAYLVTASARGFRSGLANQGEVVALTGEPRSGVDIVLARDGTQVSGRVLDATGGPVAGAELRIVHGQARKAVVVAHSDDDGRFSASVEPGAVTVHGRAEGYSSLGVARIAPTDDIEIIMTPGGAINGRVVMKGDGRAVAEAKVRAVLASTARAIERTATSDGSGSFSLQGLEPGAYLLSASGRGHRGAAAEPVVVVGVGHATDGVTIAVEATPQVHGEVVVESTSAPCRDGVVALGPPPPAGTVAAGSPAADRESGEPSSVPSSMLHAPIAADGSVHFDAVPPGRYFVNVSCGGHIWRSGPAVVEVAEANVSSLRWGVEPGCGLEVRAVDERGEPVPYAKAFLEFPPVDGHVGRQSLHTDEAGRYVYPPQLYPGSYTVTAATPYQGEPVPVELSAADRNAVVELKLLGSAAIDVLVRDEAGEPVDGIDVIGHPADQPARGDGPPVSLSLARVGARGAKIAAALGQGHYRLGPIEPGAYRIGLVDELNPLLESGPVEGGRVVEVSSGAKAEVEVLYERGLAIEGRVLDADGSAVPDAWVYLDPQQPEGAPAAGGGLRAPRSSRLTDGRGEFRFERLIDARFRLRTETPDGAGTASASGVLAGEQVTLTLQQPGTLHGEVSSASGDVPELFIVEWKQQGGLPNKRTFKNTQGRFVLERVAPGDLVLRAVAPEGQSSRLELALAPGERREGIALELDPRPSFTAPAPPGSMAERTER